MTLFLQITGALLLAVILVLVLKNNGKEIGAVLAIGMCSMVAIGTLTYLRPVLEFMRTLESIGGLDKSMVEILLKVTGIGMITEIAALVCKDTGNESMGKSLHLLGSAVILYLSVPMFSALIELFQKILGEL